MTRARNQTPSLPRREIVRTLLEDRGGLLVITGLGSATWDAAAAGDHPLTFPLWGAMGAAASIGLGLALAQPSRRVLVLTGDGEMLMGMGSFATIGAQRPGNLAIVVLDNEHYGETGMQASHTGRGVDLAAVARACGFADARAIRTKAEVATLRNEIHARPGPLLYQIKIRAESPPLVMPPRDGAWLKQRFRNALLGEGV